MKKIPSLFSQGLRGIITKLKLGQHMDSRLMYHVYLNQAAGAYLFFYFFNFLSLKFQNIKFSVKLFCEAYTVETWYTHGQRVDLLCSLNTSSQNILVPLFFFFFLSLQLAKIKNLVLQNCFSITLMATAWGMWALLTCCYILLPRWNWHSCCSSFLDEKHLPVMWSKACRGAEQSQRTSAK